MSEIAYQIYSNKESSTTITTATAVACRGEIRVTDVVQHHLNSHAHRLVTKVNSIRALPGGEGREV